MRFIFLLPIIFFFCSCNMQNGVDKDYIISQLKEKEASQIKVSE